LGGTNADVPYSEASAQLEWNGASYRRAIKHLPEGQARAPSEQLELPDDHVAEVELLLTNDGVRAYIDGSELGSGPFSTHARCGDIAFQVWGTSVQFTNLQVS
jgi:hypothetical protein